ncbi:MULTISPECIES: S8 family serine peptidase [unclassified Coleofasciculus]|uniref:S8 family serine peptidase n=1 Tax=unclassified Coleofasciculus TaxID=2692782 RepID=UPI00187F6332|nr:MULTISPECIES: S8 family peptidase [unclassified Coleofasciculus]MBE9127981.1 S8 family serine peptidase [Coleofasciculus sp. LEGE 07081]MBE9148166.1 S8 family serine peptidase [Coleofasciculus sp. LEGE 07092]
MDNLTVVYVHGIGEQPAPAVLKRSWDKALFGIDMGARTRLAYWSDIQYPQPIAAAKTQGFAIAALETERPLSDTEVIEESQQLVPESNEAHAYAEKLAQEMLANNAPSRGVSTQFFGGDLRLLPDSIRRKITEWLTKSFIQDTAAYFYNEQKREKIRDRLRQILIPENGLYLVIGHSMGSIIAYDVLRQLENSDIPIPLFLTIGSPLGIEAVKDNLGHPWKVPTGVTNWQNFADRFDPVAFDKGISNDFSPIGKIKDSIVRNLKSDSLLDFDPHSGTGYLGTKEVQRAVQEVVGSTFAQPIASFVIAKDVAEEMAGPVERLPVLIELSDEITGATLRGASATTLDTKRETLVQELQQLTHNQEEAKIDPLQRYVAAELTPAEIERLAARYKNLPFARIWKNSRKVALLDQSIHKVQAYTAQLGYGATGKDINWAILDTGIQPNHPHFQTHKNIAQQWDCTGVGQPRQGKALDVHGHGTHVAGVIAGMGKEDSPYAKFRGMAPETQLHIYKVLDDEGYGNDAWIIKALNHIASVNESSPNLVIHGVNLSLGGPFDPTVYGCGHSPICRELRRLWRQGVVVCIAAGNEGRLIIQTAQGISELNLDLSIGDPANLEEAIAVGSVHKQQPHTYGISYFSSRGPTADGRAKPDVVAPGEQIISCNANFSEEQDLYVGMSGTSMACPHVSGVVAAFLSVRQEFIGYPDRVKEILLSHCTDLKRDRYHQGAGMPNLVKMLSRT